MVEVVVEYSYDAEQPDELSIKPGDIIKNVLMVEGGWWEGELGGKKGMFPDNFVKVVKNQGDVIEKRDDTKKKQVQASKRQSVRDLANKLKDSVHEGPPVLRKKEPGSKKKRAKVVFSYDPENDDELQLGVGDMLDVLKQDEEGWWEGSLNGKQGMFPSNFVEIVDESGETVEAEKSSDAQEEENLIKGKKIHGVGLGNIFGDGPIKLRPTVGGIKPGSKPQEPPKTEKRSEESMMRKQKDTKPTEKAVVRYSYAAENEDELSLAEGEIVNVLEKELEDSGWWKGELNGKVGVFPDNFVELMKEEPAPDKAPMPVIAPTPQPKPKKPPPPSQPPAPVKTAPKLPDKTPVSEPKSEPHKDEKPSSHPTVPFKKPVHPPPPLSKKPVKPVETAPPPVKEEEKPKPEVSAGSFEAVEPAGDKLTHLTASRPRGPPKRPPSQVFSQNPKSSDQPITEEERNGDIKDSHWLKETKPPISSHPPSHPVPEKKEEVQHREKPHPVPSRPPEPTAASAGLHAALDELRKELHDLRNNSVSKAQFHELKAENESLKKEIDSVKSNYSRKLKDIMAEVDEEKKIRLSTQVEVERIRKLMAESHV